MSTLPCQDSSRLAELARSAGRGALAGLVGVAAKTTAEKVEQRLTRRPDSYVPARALLRLVGRQPSEAATPSGWNHAMHWGTGAALGALRGVWSVTGIRGPHATATHAVVRLAFDQTVENLTGTGAPPMTWPRDEQLIDVLHKAVYATATGLVSDAWISPVLMVRSGTHSH